MDSSILSHSGGAKLFVLAALVASILTLSQATDVAGAIPAADTTQRAKALAVIDAYESYAAENGTYTTDGGHNNGGQGGESPRLFTAHASLHDGRQANSFYIHLRSRLIYLSTANKTQLVNQPRRRICRLRFRCPAVCTTGSSNDVPTCLTRANRPACSSGTGLAWSMKKERSCA